jgi:hypothetical protein
MFVTLKVDEWYQLSSCVIQKLMTVVVAIVEFVIPVKHLGNKALLGIYTTHPEDI